MNVLCVMVDNFKSGDVFTMEIGKTFDLTHFTNVKKYV